MIAPIPSTQANPSSFGAPVNSWYEATRNWHQQFASLNTDINVDVCVIGAGLTGLSAALELRDAGYDVAVLEGGRVGQGASGRSGGQVLPGYGCDPHILEKQLGHETTKTLMQISADAVDLVRERIARHHIDCALQAGQTSCAVKPRHIRELAEWQNQIASYGYPHMQFLDRASLAEHINTDRYLAGVYDANAAHLHPLNYTLGLARAAVAAGVRLYEHSPVHRITPGAVIKLDCVSSQGSSQASGQASGQVSGQASGQGQTNSQATGHVQCRFVVLAGNAYLRGLMPAIENKIMPAATYITATAPLGSERARSLIVQGGAFTDVNFVLDYFKLSADHRLLFGGQVSYSLAGPVNLQRTMRTRMLNVFPQLHDVRQEYTWGGNVAITVNRAPHFGRIGKNIYYAQGYSGHGMALTTMAGRLITQAIRGQSEHFDIYSRLRHHRFPGGQHLRTPALVLGMLYYRLRDLF